MLNLFDRNTAQPEQDEQTRLLLKQANEFMSDKWEKVKECYLIYHQLVWNSFLFYVGQFWITWDTGRKAFNPDVPEDEWTPQPKINRFSPAIDAVASNFANVPEIEAVASDTKSGADLTNIGVAEISNLVAKYLRDMAAIDKPRDGEESLSEEAGQIYTLAGTVFTEVESYQKEIGTKPIMEGQDLFGVQCTQCDYYEEVPQPPEVPTCPDCGQPLQVSQVASQQQALDPLTEQPMTEPVTEARIRCEIGNPLYAFPRPGSKSLARGYFFWANRYTLDEIETRFGIEDATADNQFPDGQSNTLENNLQYWMMGFNGSSVKLEDSALVVRLFIEPGQVKDFPGGLMALMVNGSVKKATTWEYLCHPFTKGSYLNIPTLPFGRTTAFDLVEIQREKGGYESLVKLHAMTSAVDSIVIDENTQVSEITGRSDKLIKWRSVGPGSKEPHRMAHGVLDAGVYEKLQKLDMEFEHITGAVGVFRGEQPGSITAASAIADLKSQAELMFNKPVTNWNGLWIETVRKMVYLAQKTFSTPQLLEICGADRANDIANWQKANLDTALGWVATKHGLPRSREEKKAEMMQLFDAGALDINDSAVKEKIVELFGEIGMGNQFNLDATRARAENALMKTGVPVQPMPELEDLSIHFDTHLKTIKALSFDQWDPVAKKVLIQHTLETHAMLQEKMMMDAAMQGAGPDGEPGAGGKDTAPGNKPPAGGPKSKSAQQRSNARKAKPTGQVPPIQQGPTGGQQ